MKKFQNLLAGILSLGAVEIHRELMTAEHSRIIAAKL
jgi:hypothetical protein